MDGKHQLFDSHRNDLNWQLSVPVLIDDFKNYPSFEMTRCTYFSIECDEPSPGWILDLKGKKVPFHLIGLSGVIFAPSLEKMTFDSQEEIEKTFTTIEDHLSLFIDINDVWLPNFLISGPRGRGVVYRVGFKLFLMALQFRENRISSEDFHRFCQEYRRMVEYSSKESNAFMEWAEWQLKEAEREYPKKAELALGSR